MKIRKGDTVEVMTGDDAGVRGTVNRVIPGKMSLRRRGQKDGRGAVPSHDRDRVVVAGVNLVKKHQRPTGKATAQAGIIEREAPMHLSNVALVCPHCQKTTRAGFQVLDDGGKTRVCKRCSQTIE